MAVKRTRQPAGTTARSAAARQAAEAAAKDIQTEEYATPKITPKSSAVAPDGSWQHAIPPGVNERRPDPPNAEPPALDLGDYGVPEYLESLADKQLEVELLCQIMHVKNVMAMMPGDHYYMVIEKAKGAALKAEWLRRGHTIDQLRGKTASFDSLRV